MAHKKIEIMTEFVKSSIMSTIRHRLLIIIFIAVLTGCKDKKLEPEIIIEPFQDKCWMTKTKSEWIFLNDSLYSFKSRDYPYEFYYFNSDPKTYLRYSYIESYNLFIVTDFGEVLSLESNLFRT